MASLTTIPPRLWATNKMGLGNSFLLSTAMSDSSVSACWKTVALDTGADRFRILTSYPRIDFEILPVAFLDNGDARTARLPSVL